MLGTLRSLLSEHGLTLVFANVFLAQIGLPIPALPMLVIAGSLVADGTLHAAPLALAVIAASLAGDLPWYVAGRRYGTQVLRTLCRIAIEPDSCVKQTESIFTRWGPTSLIVAKYVPGFSTVAPPLAGTMHVPLRRFLLYSAAAALLWAAAPVIAGIFLHREVERALAWIEALGLHALLVLGAIVFVYVVFKGVQRYLLLRFLRMIRIHPQELHALVRSGSDPVILDARSALSRELEPRRIPGAIDVDLDRLDDAVASIPVGREVIVYCS